MGLDDSPEVLRKDRKNDKIINRCILGNDDTHNEGKRIKDKNFREERKR